MATAPFGAAHFNRIADFGFVANLLTVPVMGAAVMPAGALAALLAPIGLAAPALWVMGLGCDWILAVAHLVAGWEGAVTAVPAPGPWVLPLIAGGIWLAVWRGWLRGLGLLPLAVALAIWANTERPLLLIAPDAGLVGLMGPDGRALSSARGRVLPREAGWKTMGIWQGRWRPPVVRGSAAPRAPGCSGSRVWPGCI